MNRIELVTALLVVGALSSCDPSGGIETDPITENHSSAPQDTTLKHSGGIDALTKVIDEKKIKHGIKIKWFEHGDGAEINDGDVVYVDYKVRLDNGEIIDGNHLIKWQDGDKVVVGKESIPFMVGFGMQTPGWDLALKELRVGDKAEVFIPAKMARGEQSVEGLFPANSDNILKIHIVEKPDPDRTIDGNKVWIFEENKENKTLFSEDHEVDFHCMAFSPTSPMFVNTYRTDTPFTMKLEDHGLIPGLKKALINAKKGDRMLVYVPSSEAYHTKGFQDLVKPNEDVMYNVLIMDVRDL